MTYTEISQTGWPLLMTLQLLPLFTGLVLLRLKGAIATFIAVFASVIQLLLSLNIYTQFNAATHLNPANFHFVERFKLLSALEYHAGLDGMGMVFVLLTALIGLLILLFVIYRHLYQGTRILAIVLLIQASITSQFLSLDLLWFLLMSIIEMGLIAYLLNNWATDIDASQMLRRFIKFMTTSLLLTGIGVVSLGWLYAGALGNGYWSFDLILLSQLELKLPIANMIFFFLFFGLAIRVPLFPLHGWLADFVRHGNIAAAPALLIGLKVGIFALLRFVFPIVPEAVIAWQPIILGMSLVGVFYAAFLAMRQNNLRTLIAFAVISHSGIIMIALFSFSQIGFSSSLMLAAAFGLSVSGLLWMTGIVWQRTGTINIDKLNNLFERLPHSGQVIGITFLICSVAMFGMPFTASFEGMHLMLEASLHTHGALIAVPVALAGVITAAFLFRAFQTTFLSQADTDTLKIYKEPKTIIVLLEKTIAILVLFAVVSIGVYSKPLVDLANHSSAPLSVLYETTLSQPQTGNH